MTRRELALGFVLLVVTIVLLAAIAEVGLRVAMRLGIPAVRDPAEYADWFSDDDFWKLHRRWVPAHNTPTRERVHPLLGWATPRTADNPLGVMADAPYVPDTTRPAVLFYGDSFMQGVVGNAQSIPSLVAERLPGPAAYNYGVGGYGVDQMLLRVRLSARRFARPVVVVGILTVDLDRSLLTVRAGPKPSFVPHGRGLALRGVPVPSDAARWFVEHPPSIHSYALAWLRCRASRLLWGWEGLSPARRRATEEVNARLLEKLVDAARSRRVPLLFVVFYRQLELGPEVGWREGFLKRELARLGAPVVDTTAVLDRRGGFYRREGHLNARGNRRVSEAVADALAALTSPPGAGS